MRHAILGFLIFSLVGLAACQDDATRLQEHMTRGEAYADEDRYEEAIIEFKSALQIDPNVADAHYGLAHAYLRSEKPRETHDRKKRFHPHTDDRPVGAFGVHGACPVNTCVQLASPWTLLDPAVQCGPGTDLSVSCCPIMTCAFFLRRPSDGTAVAIPIRSRHGCRLRRRTTGFGDS